MRLTRKQKLTLHATVVIVTMIFVAVSGRHHAKMAEVDPANNDTFADKGCYYTAGVRQCDDKEKE